MVCYKVCKIASDICPQLYTYGIAATEGKKVLFEINDVSTDKKLVKKLKRLCNKNKVSPIHLKDIIEDFLVK